MVSGEKILTNSKTKPLDAALELWGTIAPGRKPKPNTTAFFPFTLSEAFQGYVPNLEIQQFVAYLGNYGRPSMINEIHDSFLVALSIDPANHTSVSFKLTVLSSRNYPYCGRSPIMVLRELPEVSNDRYTHPYNLLIIGEKPESLSQKADHRLDSEQNGRLRWSSWRKKWPEEPAEDIDWQKHFTVRILQHFAEQARGTDIQGLIARDKEIQDDFLKKDRERGWWNRVSSDMIQPGAVIKDVWAVNSRRLHHWSSTQLSTLLQQAYP